LEENLMATKTTTTRTNTTKTPQRTTTGGATPQGWSTITPSLTVPDVQEAAEFYQTLGFEVVDNTPGPGGAWMHAQLRFGESNIMVGTPQPGTKWTKPKGLTNVALYTFVGDVDNVYEACKKLGYKPESAPVDQFWGDRTFNVTDPWGYTWTFATHVREVSPQEMQRAMAN
jgi:PhnB protein